MSERVAVAASAGGAGEPSERAPSPPGVRLPAARWRDSRLLIGVLLIVLSTLLGARLVASARRSTALMGAATALPAGHLLRAADLVVVDAHLPARSLSGYWPAGSTTRLIGHSLELPLSAGELVPRNAVSFEGPAQPRRVVSVPVDPARLADAAPGDRVDVFVTYKAAATASAVGTTVAVVRGVVFLGTGGSSASGSLAVRLLVPPQATAALVHASELGSLDVVRQQPAGVDPGDVGSSPVVGP